MSLWHRRNKPDSQRIRELELDLGMRDRDDSDRSVYADVYATDHLGAVLYFSPTGKTQADWEAVKGQPGVHWKKP